MLKETIKSIEIEIEMRKLEIQKAELDIICFRRELNRIKNENSINEIKEKIQQFEFENHRIKYHSNSVPLSEEIQKNIFSENEIKIANLQLKLEDLENE